MRCRRFLLFLPVAICLISCTRTQLGNTISAAAIGAAANSQAPPALMLFGGEEHHTYLGCLNCSKYSSDSIFNAYGQHGSAYSTDSVWNSYSDFGSRYSDQGVCNPYASDPPAIVDSEGKFYGRLTLNFYHPELGVGQSYVQWLRTVVCK